MPEVAVARIDFLFALLDGNLVQLGIIDGRLARGEFEIRVFPRRDDFQRRVERHIGKLEPHLIVALAGCAVRDGRCLFGVGDIDLIFRYQRPCDARAEEIAVFIDRAGFEHRPKIIFDKFLAQIL